MFLICGATSLASTVGRAQKSKVPRHAADAEAQGAYFTALVQGFRDLGYADGHIVLEHRFGGEMPERFRDMAAELVALDIDVLVTVGPQTAPYAKTATTTIPPFSWASPTRSEANSSRALHAPGRI
jgi:putative ABC transport system substrate-binding protein